MASDQPIASYGDVTLTDLQRMANAGQIQLTTGVSPATDTPDGYHLIHPGHRRSAYRYDSDWVYQADEHCNLAGCTLKAETRVALWELVQGTTSHRWGMVYYGRTWTDPGGLTWQFHARYYCGVNIHGGNDHVCTNGASPSGREVAYDDHDTFYESWGKTNSITVFPMAALSTHFSTGLVVTTKFRGWDTLSRSRTTRLRDTSDGGG